MRVVEPKLDLVMDAHNHLGESPLWSVEEQALYWINCEEPPEVRRWDARTHDVQVWPMPRRIGGISFRKGGLIVALADGLYDMQLPSGLLRQLVRSLMSQASLHESVTDRDGCIWVGAYDDRLGKEAGFIGSGSLFRFDRDQLVPVVNEIQCSNAMAFSPDGETLYHGDATTGIVKTWTLDRVSGALSNEAPFAHIAPADGYFDGATVDEAGGYWASLVFGGKLRRYNADRSIDLEVKLPFTNPTKIPFGGADLSTLFITTTQISMGTPLPGEALHGGLYSFRPGFKGIQEVAVDL